MGEASPEWRERQVNERFSRWEVRGRGWKVFDKPVGLEPAFTAFPGHYVPAPRQLDEGRQDTWISRLLSGLSKSTPSPSEDEEPEREEEPEPERREYRGAVELPMSFPSLRTLPSPQMEGLIRQAARTGESLAFELLSTESETVPQFVALPRSAPRLKVAVEACIPGIAAIPTSNTLLDAWGHSEGSFAVVEFGLGAEFMLPLRGTTSDLLCGVATAMECLSEGELGLYQVLFEPVQNDWRESIVRAVTKSSGQPFFANRPELARAAHDKCAVPLFGVVLRLASSAADLQRAWEIIVDLAAPLAGLGKAGANFLVPLANEGYSYSDHEQDILNRQSRRSGMLLNMEELTGLITPPASSKARKIRRETKRTKAAPDILSASRGLSLGQNAHAGITRTVSLSPEHRVRHAHLIGASGTGKSTLLLNLIRHDIEAGEGVAVFDPHGDLVDTILGNIPEDRIDDVVLLDPSDEEFSVGLNILAAHSDSEKGLLASDLTSVFRRLSTSWGDQMESVLRNSILAFLESSRGGTLADLRRFLLEPTYRKEFLTTVTDSEIVYYWRKAFPLLSGGKSIGPLLTRLDGFLSRKPIRHMVSQSDNRIDFAEIIDRGRILLVKLPQGLIGRENTALLGSLITAKLQMAAMSRQRMPEAQRRDFWCYMDEFQNFLTPSMGEILAGARKYRLGLILAHQELRQLQADGDVASSVLSNCYTRIVFKVGDADARALEGGFADFEAPDLMNLSVGEAVCRVERSDFDFNLAVRLPAPPRCDSDWRRQEVVAESRRKYATRRGEIEALLLRHLQADESNPTAPATPGNDSPQPKLAKAAAVPTDAVPSIIEQFPTRPSGATSEVESPIPKSPSESPALPHDVTAAASPNADKEPLATDSASPPAKADPPPPRDLGRGGAQHQAIQRRLKEAAEALGFRATLEKEILQGRGSVDVLLERPPHTIACEISVTTTVDHEVRNVSKCFKANLTAIAVVAADRERLSKIEAAVVNSLGAEVASRTSYFLPDQFIDHLRLIPIASLGPAAEVEVRRGYKVKRKVVPLTEEERAAREQEALRLIAATLRERCSPGATE